MMKIMQDDENKLVLDDAENTSAGRIYEVGYLLTPTIAEEDVAVSYGNLKELVSSLGGEIISSEIPKMLELAYPMFKVLDNVKNKFKSAYFGWIKFEIDSQKVLELKKRLRLDLSFIRFIVLKTVKENTIANKRFVHRDAGYHKTPSIKKKKEDEGAVPINKEEIDKEIEAMVAI